MADGSSEEKQHPASAKKLRDARRRGEVPQSRDLVAGITLTATVLYLFLAWPALHRRLVALIDTAAVQSGAPRPGALPVAEQAGEALLAFLLPLVLATIGVVILAGASATLGVIFAPERIQPRFERLDPASGFRRLMSMRSLLEFGKSIAKIILLLSTFVLVLGGFLPRLFLEPPCGPACLGPSLLAVLRPLAVLAVLLLLVIGVADMILQRRLFLRDQRMTTSERKREHKDMEGDPHLQAERRRLRREMAEQGPAGLAQASFVISDGQRIIALRFNREDSPVPVIVAKNLGEGAAKLHAEAQALGLPVVKDDSLIESLSAGPGVGERIAPALFTPVAGHLVQLGLI
ncbi:EscU/YscU/HrcU family type III secretion system export apparatus switch protein [Chelatococcus sp. GCM10030263]|uniref:EscU/YscU/HrcU family type III secretion system export apparatus switch protein n=1 Tax=Chelatococcus sp. GCM10030263 TaxID=3273387 RepID=UPI0036159B13